MSQQKKIRVAVIFGGRSAEHEISIKSARNVMAALNPEKYEVIPIGIDRQGRWQLQQAKALLQGQEMQQLVNENHHLALVPGQPQELFIAPHQPVTIGEIDVVFPVLHGPYGEDGTIQGLLRLANIPYVGAGVLGSAIGMDKDVMKRLLQLAGLPITQFKVFTVWDEAAPNFQELSQSLGLPFFVKPANLGSSVGISKVQSEEQFQAAITTAFEYDNKIIIESYFPGREIECAVLGNHHLRASLPGEVIPHHDFYSYEAKYLDDNGASFEVPANLSPEMITRIQQLAIQACKVLCCEGMARVDFFVQDSGALVINEINTIPGFTAISMYPKMWEVSGLPYSELVDRLVGLALEKYSYETRLKSDFATA